MNKIKIKPLSINEAFQWKRYKTDKYKTFEQELYYSLPQIDIPEWKLKVSYIFWLSSKNADYDNPIKTCQDVLQKKYNFNDSRIYKGIIEKVDVKKWQEFIEFKILPFD